MSIIHVENLSKEFKRQKRKPGLGGAFQSLFHREYEIKTAVNDICFQVEKGEILGYLGPNGAGKSTTIKMMTGILVPTAGRIEVNGIIPYENRIENAKRIGVVFGQRTQLWWDIPVSESLSLLQSMYRIPQRQYRENMSLFSDILGLREFINIPVRQLSLGQRMRADLAAALLHNPDILYLDEPTIGLDVVVKENIRKFIKEINKERETTIILTTHDTSDIEKLCSRVMVIDNGSIMYDGSLDDLRNTYGTEELLIIETGPAPTGLEELDDPGVTELKQEDNKLYVKYDKTQTNSSLIMKWFMDRFVIKDFSVREVEVEDIIRKLYRKELAYDAEGVGVQ